MKQICTLCERTTNDGNLWCQENDCPMVQMPQIFSYGEFFGDLEIVKFLIALRSSAIYEAVRDDQPVLLKIAHDGNHARLKREAQFLQSLQKKNISHPMLPKLLPAHRGTNLAYGKVAYRGRLKYYCIFEHSEGDFLREFLLKNSQPWFQHAGWIALSLTDVIGLLHQENLLHLALCPECIQVRFEKGNEVTIPRIMLLDLGACTDRQNVALHWQTSCVPTAYIAPELLKDRAQANASTDLYGIGLILYEMLAGHPAYEFRLREEAAIRKDVVIGKKQRIDRGDLKTLPQIAEKAAHVSATRRYAHAKELLRDLLNTLPRLPKEKPKRKWERKTIFMILAAAIIIPMLLVVAILLSNPPAF